MELIRANAEIITIDSNPLKHIEKIARTCYKSEDKITDESAPKFVKMLYERGHHAMLEFYPFYFYIHKELISDFVYINQSPEINGDFMWQKRASDFVVASCNLRTAIMLNQYNELVGKVITNRYPELNGLFNFIIGTGNEDLIHLAPEELMLTDLIYSTVRFICDRGVTHELVRHRKCSFAQESTRYCNYGKQEHVKFIIPSWLDIKDGMYSNVATFLKDNNQQDNDETPIGTWAFSNLNAEMNYKKLLAYEWSPQQARSILPNDLKTEIVVQARLSEWKHIFEQRCAKTAHPDMQALMIPLRDKMNVLYDNYFNS